MKKLILILSLISSNLFATDAALYVTSAESLFSSEWSDELIVSKITLLNVSESYAEHYIFEMFENGNDIENICYLGNFKEVIFIIKEILSYSTGDSFQELGKPSIENNTIIFPYSYVYEGGHSGSMQAVVKPCK